MAIAYSVRLPTTRFLQLGFSMIVLSVIDDAVKGLQREPDPARIKKLMVYACTGAWETSPQRLSQVSLRQLVEQLWTIAPTLEHLRSHLYKIVSTLNKQAEYTLVANAIMKHFNALYLIEQPQEPASSRSQYHVVVQSLEQSDDALRVKKLLFCACKNSWQNDLSLLNQFSLLYLVEHLHSLAPTLDSLTTILSSIVHTLNRQAVYQRVLHMILEAFQPLYTDHQPSTRMVEPAASPDPKRSPPPVTHIVFPTPATADPSTPAQTIDTSQILDAMFDLRLEVMKYTNPLRAKLLIFFCLREPIADLSQGIQMVRSQELGNLLKELILSYPSFEQIDQRLRGIASQQADGQHYTQTASAVLRAIKPIYDRFPNSAAALKQMGHYEAEVTEVNANEADATGLRASPPAHEITGVNTNEVDVTGLLASPPSYVDTLIQDDSWD
ncbi:MAG TPA: hypothetical protein V6D20_22645 [Candidatus Obscuribacterales bacterium]